MPPRPELEIRVPLVVRELWSGDHLAFPIADPKLAAFGSEIDVLEEVRLFLREHLARIPAQLLSSFTIPEKTAFLSFDIDVPRENLPRRLQPTHPISLKAIVIDIAAERWVIIPKLEHTF